MSVIYRNGELSRIIFTDKPAARPTSRLYDIGTHIRFVQQIASPSLSIAVSMA